MKIFLFIPFLIALFSCIYQNPTDHHYGGPSLKRSFQDTIKKIILSDNEWKKRLDSIEFNILREKGTEHAYTGKYWDHYKKGIYHCKGCNLPLFESSTKFKSGTGWPSFYDIIALNVSQLKDNYLGVIRTELICLRCNGHLGHVFKDGPKPTGLRYCINSASLQFISK